MSTVVASPGHILPNSLPGVNPKVVDREGVEPLGVRLNVYCHLFYRQASGTRSSVALVGLEPTSIPRSKRRWSTNCLQSRQCPGWDSNPQNSGSEPKMSTKGCITWTYRTVGPEALASSYPAFQTGANLSQLQSHTVSKVGLEPTRPFGPSALNRRRMPIPPLGQFSFFAADKHRHCCKYLCRLYRLTSPRSDCDN